MILIADSGSTKTQWNVIRRGQLVCEVFTKGLNPYFQTPEEMGEELRSALQPHIPEGPYAAVRFFGAGCTPEKIRSMEHVLVHNLSVGGIVEVGSDMLGAARSTCGREAGIACILGTGSNSCFYDGTAITANVSPLGFILGDEGSGAVLGRLLVGLLLVMLLALGSGRYPLGWSDLPRLLGSPSELDRLVAWDLRLPRILAALFTGACLASAGWIFQRMSRNALASPDIIGLSTGSATGGLVVILLLGHSDVTQAASSVPLGTLVGGLLTIALVYALSARRGIGGQWMILAGIAVGALLSAVNDYLITRADIDDALMARTWLFGSLQGADWTLVTVMAVLGIPLLALAALQAPALDLLEMGDEVAGALGLPVRRARSILLLVGVALTALVIALAGPIGFVALVRGVFSGGGADGRAAVRGRRYAGAHDARTIPDSSGAGNQHAGRGLSGVAAGAGVEGMT